MILLTAIYCVGRAEAFENESLNYRVMYKWGLVNKQAGHATLSLRTDGIHYDTRLVAASESWADAFFKVRDTLIGVVEVKDFRPLIYKKLSHEGGDHKHDVVTYSYDGNNVIGEATRKKWDKNRNLKLNEKRTLTAAGLTVDMLSAFYYMRNRPYNEWENGHTLHINIFSGKRKEILTITYLGQETITVDKKTYRTYHITFTFTDPEKPGKQTSDPMDAWISADVQRIPIKLEGKLKVGKVQCFYTGSN
ncbi:MAG: DUF3108 domain-containing protein [Muribaculaceae bacterium]|nr:DUF3108 domain-containing protein [Muribaculaceae bacterium]